jgi:hypothetical protein
MSRRRLITRTHAVQGNVLVTGLHRLCIRVRPSPQISLPVVTRTHLRLRARLQILLAGGSCLVCALFLPRRHVGRIVASKVGVGHGNFRLSAAGEICLIVQGHLVGCSFGSIGCFSARIALFYINLRSSRVVLAPVFHLVGAIAGGRILRPRLSGGHLLGQAALIHVDLCVLTARHIAPNFEGFILAVVRHSLAATRGRLLLIAVVRGLLRIMTRHVWAHRFILIRVLVIVHVTLSVTLRGVGT